MDENQWTKIDIVIIFTMILFKSVSFFKIGSIHKHSQSTEDRPIFKPLVKYSFILISVHIKLKVILYTMKIM